jgi:hypothetical protein
MFHAQHVCIIASHVLEHLRHALLQHIREQMRQPHGVGISSSAALAVLKSEHVNTSANC